MEHAARPPARFSSLFELMKNNKKVPNLFQDLTSLNIERPTSNAQRRTGRTCPLTGSFVEVNLQIAGGAA